MNRVKVIVSDIDGTLLNDDKDLTEVTKDTLIQAQEKGYKLILASGRNVSMVMPLAKELRMDEFKGLIIGSNGQQRFDFSDEEFVEEGVLDSNIAKEIFNFAKRNHLQVLVEHKGGFLIHTPWILLPVKIILLYLKTRHMLKRKETEPYQILSGFMMEPSMKVKSLHFAKQLDIEVTKMGISQFKLLFNAKEKRLKELFGSRVNLSKVTSFWYDVMPSGMNKAVGLEWASKKLDIPLSDFMAFGDAHNDIEMIEAVGLGYAMANAMEEVKQSADYICASNNDNGIASVISALINH
ncbi:MAG: HAD family hydrolase [Erysipelothrix sp.]|nr:HAD family hydrolase [Erysipelothrix sp.]